MKKLIISALLSIFLVSCNYEKLSRYKLESVELIESKSKFNVYNVIVSDSTGTYDFRIKLNRQISDENLRIGDSVIISNNFIFIDRLK